MAHSFAGIVEKREGRRKRSQEAAWPKQPGIRTLNFVNQRKSQAQPSLTALFRSFLLIGVTTFGGGRAAYFQDELVERRNWITNEEFLEAVAVSQLLPGPNIGNLAAYLGQRLHGWMGALIGLLCLVVPGGVAIVVMAWLYFNGMPSSVTKPVGTGVAAAAAGLGAATLVRLRGGAGGPTGVPIAGLAFVLFGPLEWPIYLVLAVCLPPSFALAWVRHHR